MLDKLQALLSVVFVGAFVGRRDHPGFENKPNLTEYSHSRETLQVNHAVSLENV